MQTVTAVPHPVTTRSGEGAESRPIAYYGLLADCNSAALVSNDGSVDWLCLPRYDSPAISTAMEGTGRSARPLPPPASAATCRARS